MVNVPPTENVPVGQLKVDGRNPNRMDAAKFEALKKNLEKFGFLVPIIANRDLVIADGQHRWEAAQALGMTEVPVVRLDVSEVDRRILRQVLNKLRGEHELQLDAEEYRFLLQEDSLGELASLLAAQESELVGLMKKVDFIAHGNPNDVPEVQTPVAKPGQAWKLGDHVLVCGDSTNSDAFSVFEQKADLLLTDPPYGVSYAEKNKYLNALAKGNSIQVPIEGDSKTPAEMSVFWSWALNQAYGACKPGAAYYCFGPQGGDLLLLLLMQALNQTGWMLKHQLIWVKNNHVLGRSDYNYKHEPILYGWKQDGSHSFYGGHDVSVWEYDKPHNSDLHPTMKPIELLQHAIENSTKPGEVVLDPFAGSGSTLIACEMTGRKCYAVEIDAHYCDVTIARWEKITGKQASLLPRGPQENTENEPVVTSG